MKKRLSFAHRMQKVLELCDITLYPDYTNFIAQGDLSSTPIEELKTEFEKGFHLIVAKAKNANDPNMPFVSIRQWQNPKTNGGIHNFVTHVIYPLLFEIENPKQIS